jgi:hypothetical protein
MKLCSFALCVMLLSSVWAQDNPAGVSQPEVEVKVKPAAAASGNPRPRIGLVLEGGRALGLAHVGVIKWLEENRIPMYEAGKAYGQPSSTTKVAQDATVGVLFQTLFGPMFFGGSLGDNQHRKFFFQVGRFF